MLGDRKYFGKVSNWTTTVFASDSQEARLMVARKYQLAKFSQRTIADILTDTSVRRARQLEEVW